MGTKAKVERRSTRQQRVVEHPRHQRKKCIEHVEASRSRPGRTWHTGCWDPSSKERVLRVWQASEDRLVYAVPTGARWLVGGTPLSPSSG